MTLHCPPRLKFLLGIAVMLGISIAAGAPSKAASGPLDSDALESTPLNPPGAGGGFVKFDQSTATSRSNMHKSFHADVKSRNPSLPLSV